MPPRLINYAPLFEKAREAERCTEARASAATHFKRKADAITDASARDGVPGDAYMREVERILDSFEGYKRSDAQKDFHKAFLTAVLPHIYGQTDFERYGERVKRERGITEMQQEVLVCCPRRFGKTTAVSMFVAAMLYVVPDTWISCFSTGQRASTTLLDQAARFFGTLPGAKDRILKKNQEQFFIRGKDSSDVRRFHSFPSSVAGLKGQGGKVIILEEASRLDEAVFNEVCLPLLGVSNTSLLAISTPLEENNFFSQLLLAKKPNGASLFKNITIELICAACREAKLMECPHMATKLPSWKSAARGELVKTLMENNKDMWLREQAGVVTSRDTSAFDRAGVDAAFAHANRAYRLRLVPQDDRIYVSIDPSGGGFSQTACIAAILDANTKNVVVIAADGCAVTSDAELEVYLRGFFERLRVHFPNAMLVTIIERNFGGSVLASRIADVASRFPPTRAVSGDNTAHRRVGVVTTDVVKERGRVDVQRMLRTETLRFLHDDEFMTGDARILQDMREQMLAFKFVYTSRPNGHVKAALSGKTYGKNDDMVMALMLLCYWSSYSISTPTCLV
jgi:hypothetical protein